MCAGVAITVGALLMPSQGCTGGAASTLDAAEINVNALVGCNTLTQQGDLIEIQTANTDLPNPAGGALPVGTFVLRRATFHDPRGVVVGPTGVSLRQTMSFAGETVETVQQDSLGVSRSTAIATIDGVYLRLVDNCVAPEGGSDATKGDLRVRFSTDEAGVLFVIDDPATDAGLGTSMYFDRPSPGDR
jgi:hypothetical protein